MNKQPTSLSDQDFVRLPQDHDLADAIVRPSVSYWRDVLRRILSDKVAIVSFAVIVLITLVAIFAPIFSPYGYATTDLLHTNLPPSAEHWFGTDSVGRDLWARVWVGARVSLLIGLGGAIVPQVIGIFLGGLSGYFGGWVDMLIMRIIDVGVCIPSLVYVTLIMLWLDSGPVAIIIAIAITGWMDSARIVRGCSSSRAGSSCWPPRHRAPPPSASSSATSCPTFWASRWSTFPPPFRRPSSWRPTCPSSAWASSRP